MRKEVRDRNGNKDEKVAVIHCTNGTMKPYRNLNRPVTSLEHDLNWWQACLIISSAATPELYSYYD